MSQSGTTLVIPCAKESCLTPHSACQTSCIASPAKRWEFSHTTVVKTPTFLVTYVTIGSTQPLGCVTLLHADPSSRSTRVIQVTSDMRCALLYCLQALRFLRFPWNRSRHPPTSAANVHADRCAAPGSSLGKIPRAFVIGSPRHGRHNPVPTPRTIACLCDGHHLSHRRSRHRLPYA